MATTTQIEKFKMARRIVTDKFDSEIGDLLDASMTDMQIAGVRIPATLTPIVETASITYAAMHFGDPDDYDKLKKSYDEQKAQLATFTALYSGESE